MSMSHVQRVGIRRSVLNVALFILCKIIRDMVFLSNSIILDLLKTNLNLKQGWLYCIELLNTNSIFLRLRLTYGKCTVTRN